MFSRFEDVLKGGTGLETSRRSVAGVEIVEIKKLPKEETIRDKVISHL